MLLANLRRDIAFAELQNSFGTVYASIGLDVVPNNLSDMSIDGLSNAITQSLQTWGLKYKSVVGASRRVIYPIGDQNPMLSANGFVFAANTFDVGQPVQYSIGMQDGTALPDWLSFDGNLRKISGVPPQQQMQLSLRVIAQGPDARATDSFILRLDDAKKTAITKTEKAAPIAAAPVAKPVAPKPTPAPTAAATGQASRFVQAKALSSRLDAQKYADKIENTVGLKSFVRKTKRRNPPLYRVIIPAFSRQDIPSIIQALKKMDINDAFVARE